MRNTTKLVSSGIALTVIFGCVGGGDTDVFANDKPVIYAIYPCIGTAGDTVDIVGKNLRGVGGSLPPTVDLNGVAGTVNAFTNAKVSFSVPGGGTNSKVHLSNTIGQDSSFTTFIYQGRQTIHEVEPNDDINGVNATHVGKHPTADGTLSSAADKDHFLFDCIEAGISYKLKITPRVVGTIYLDGVAVAVDAVGFAHFQGTRLNTLALIGLTGGVGNYSLEMSLE